MKRVRNVGYNVIKYTNINIESVFETIRSLKYQGIP